jgi:Bacteriocin-protection, YdeI or OmpD-Associated/Domain of unknown function (DUF1905)
MQKFTAEIKKAENVDGTYVEIPFDVEAVFGAKRVKVKAQFDGAEYRGSIVRMGGCFMLGMTQALRKQISKGPGDMVEVMVEKDEEERTIELPEDFQVALEGNAAAKEFYSSLSFTHKKEYVQWILSAKKAETRTARIDKAIDMLENKQKTK